MQSVVSGLVSISAVVMSTVARHGSTCGHHAARTDYLRQWRRWLPFKSWQGLLVLALVFGMDGAWLQAKAWLAQYLIATAWNQSVQQQAPVKPWPWADTWPVARLQVPAAQVDLMVLDGTHGGALAFGPGRLNGTADPGAGSLSILGGHRDTHFAFLKELKVGDDMVVTDREGEQHHYAVDQLQVVNIRETPLLADPAAHRLLLITCYPFNALRPGGDLRYIVSALPVGEGGHAADRGGDGLVDTTRNDAGLLDGGD